MDASTGQLHLFWRFKPVSPETRHYTIADRRTACFVINVRTKVKLQSYVVMGYVKSTVDIGWVIEINPAHLVQKNKNYVVDVVKRYKGPSFNGFRTFL